MSFVVLYYIITAITYSFYYKLLWPYGIRCIIDHDYVSFRLFSRKLSIIIHVQSIGFYREVSIILNGVLRDQLSIPRDYGISFRESPLFKHLQINYMI